jgi:hypothetical protein
MGCVESTSNGISSRCHVTLQESEHISMARLQCDKWMFDDFSSRSARFFDIVVAVSAARMLGVGYSSHGRMSRDLWPNGDLVGVSLDRSIMNRNKDNDTSTMRTERMVSLQRWLWRKFHTSMRILLSTRKRPSLSLSGIPG